MVGSSVVPVSSTSKSTDLVSSILCFSSTSRGFLSSSRGFFSSRGFAPASGEGSSGVWRRRGRSVEGWGVGEGSPPASTPFTTVSSPSIMPPHVDRASVTDVVSYSWSSVVSVVESAMASVSPAASLDRTDGEMDGVLPWAAEGATITTLNTPNTTTTTTVCTIFISHHHTAPPLLGSASTSGSSGDVLFTLVLQLSSTLKHTHTVATVIINRTARCF